MRSKNRGRTPRSCEDIIPSEQSRIRKIHRIVDGSAEGYERYIPQRWWQRTVQRPLGHPAKDLPVRRHKVPCVRTSSRNGHPKQGRRDTHPAISCWLNSWMLQYIEPWVLRQHRTEHPIQKAFVDESHFEAISFGRRALALSAV